ncbi:MAG: response regulator [Sulfuricurvum sp.]|uniref:response regulator transcription factor n=1 Tax=Sulfuricurvum sp. TaxID=2025608 RepID=UPI0026232044|nr:response regulator [Sulfuricurvum sp.]MDD2829539.1 response regulator [Sulfuricurvum sp.]MDD4950471.1 response regulator [Sulfuricurvum sp.]
MKQFTLSELKLITSELRVLYVEDEAMIRDGLLASLKQLFKEVDAAENGSEGLKLYNTNHYDLIITDISMPTMDGITMIDQIKEVNSEAPIIVTSAQNDADRLLTLINLGVDRFLTKPINKINLINALYSVCSAIDNRRKIKAYQEDLEHKIRILQTQIKKEHIKSQQVKNVNPIPCSEANQDYFSQLLPDEIDELRDLNEELDSDILMMFQNDHIDYPSISHIAKQYGRYGAILYAHTLFVEIGLQLQEMARAFEIHKDVFIEKISSLRELLESFNFTLITFRQNVWEKPSSDPCFYNASLLSDIQLIHNILTQTEVDGEIEFF